MDSERIPIVILGAGPAGLGSALQLARRGSFEITVLERNKTVGGNAGSLEIDGLRADYGSHRLHPACAPQVLADIRGMLGSDLVDRPRHGRIWLKDRWVHFPLKPTDLALNLPPSFLLGVLRDTLLNRSARGDSHSFAAVLERSLGRTICREFYFPYAEKIWGIPPEQLDAEQARRRVSAASMSKMIRKVLQSVPGFRRPGAGRFFYPRRGYGQISEAYAEAARKLGVTIRMDTPAARVEIEAGRATAVTASQDGRPLRLQAHQILSTIPLPTLVHALSPSPPPEVLASAANLQYRAMILVYLVLSEDRFTEYDAHYFPSLDIPIARLSEPKNYGLVGKAGATVLCAELPCSTDDSIWQMTDDKLAALVLNTLNNVNLTVRTPVHRVATRRLREAYPLYVRDYREHFERLDNWLTGVKGLLVFGRQGLFVHDNTHHTLAMAYAASECIGQDGRLDRDRWRMYRRAFETHVVED